MVSNLISPCDFVVLRTPLLPFSEFTNLLSARSQDSDCSARTDESAPRSIRCNLREFFANKAAEEALLTASRSLHARLKNWDPVSEETKSLKTAVSLLKYASRMCYRSTPFGLLSGTSWSQITPDDARSDSDIELGPIALYKRSCRLDMGILARFHKKVFAAKETRKRLWYFANPTLHRRGARWQYVEAVDLASGTRFEMSEVDCTDYLDALIQAVESKSIVSHAELAHVLRKVSPSSDSEEIEQYLDGLYTNGIFLSSLTPKLTVTDPVGEILLDPCHSSLGEALEPLMRAHRCIAELSALSVGSGIGRTVEIEANVKSLFDTDSRTDSIQTDLYKPICSARLSMATIDSVRSATEMLLLLSTAKNTELALFQESFVKRYGDQETRLVDALDPDAGLSYGGKPIDNVPLLQGMSFREAARRSENGTNQPTPFARLLTRSYESACCEGRSSIVLHDQDIQPLLGASDRYIPPSMFALVSIFKNQGELTRPAVVVRAVGAPTSAMVGRFCAADEHLANRMREYLTEEERLGGEEILYTEVVHWPVGRIGNIIVRPQLRTSELPLYGRPTVDLRSQVHIRDILISVQNDRIVLRHSLSGRLLKPRLSSAHNVLRDSVPLYRFLASLQKEESFGSFAWPVLLLSVRHLPRVIYHDCILSAETWHLSREELVSLQKGNPSELRERVNQLRQSLSWPRFVELVDGDNCLCIDLDNSLSVECLLDELRSRTVVILREAFIPNGDGAVRGPEGEYCHELILPFLRTADTAFTAKQNNVLASLPSDLETDHLPGGEWMYLKVYAGSAAQEKIIRAHMGHLVSSLRAAQLVTKWFFLRYADPDLHLRIRFNGAPEKLWSDGLALVHKFLNAIREEKLTWQISIDTYKPELKRYGGRQAMLITEQMFTDDSDFAVSLLNADQFKDPVDRWKWMVYSIDKFYEASGVDLSKRGDAYARIAAAQRVKFEDSNAFTFSVDRKYRQCRRDLESLVFGPSENVRIVPLCFEERFVLLEKGAALLRTLVDAMTFDRILISQVHMSINRLCVSSAKAQELLVYELLARLYEGRSARARSRKTDCPEN